MAEDDLGHAALIRKNLKRAGIINEIVHFENGQQLMDFLFNGDTPKTNSTKLYLLLLDIRMPKVDGIEVLKNIKNDPELNAMPVIMLTTTDDPREVKRCHKLGCSNFITKPVGYPAFIEAIRKLGLFLTIVNVPELDNNPA